MWNTRMYQIWKEKKKLYLLKCKANTEIEAWMFELDANQLIIRKYSKMLKKASQYFHEFR